MRFSDDMPSAPEAQGGGIADPIDVEMERDLAVYRSYCALRTFMDAMYFCADTLNWDSYVQV